MMKKILKKISLLKIVAVLLVIVIAMSVVSKLPELQLKYTDVNEAYKEDATTLGLSKSVIKEIDKSINGNVLVAEEGGRKLYVNPTTFLVTVVDDATGTVWTSFADGVVAADGKVNSTEKKAAPMIVTFLEETGTTSVWDVYEQCIALDNSTKELGVGEEYADTYTISMIPNGFRAELNVTQADSKELDQYMPKKISIARYEECFLAKIEVLKQEAIDEIAAITGYTLTKDEDGNVNTIIDAEILKKLEEKDAKNYEANLEKIDAAISTINDAEKYVKALDMIYDIDAETEDHYYNKYAGTPPATVTEILIELSKKVQYTREELINDTRDNNVAEIEFTQPADFIVIMDVTLENGDLVVHIPTYEIINKSEDQEYYTLQSISVFPNFGTVNATKFDEGFIFVPDGSGALFNINSYDSGYVEYSRPIYNNKYYDTLYQDTEYNEDLMMPVFGMGVNGAVVVEEPAEVPADAEAEAVAEEPAEEVETGAAEEATEPEFTVEEIKVKSDKDLEVTSGFMGIIERGAETASLTVTLGDKASTEAIYNKVYPTFELMQFSNVKVFGPYSTSTAEFLAKTGLFNMDIKLRYKLYADNCNYYTMAEDYKDYLVKTYALEESYSKKAPEIFLDVVSSLTVEDRFLGVPYDRTVSMTTYSELNDILNDLGNVETVVSYKGAYNGGIYNTINMKAEKTSANGSEKEYETLMSNHGDSIYMSTPISYVYKDTSAFNANKHALLGFDSEPAVIYDYDIPSGMFDMHSHGHWIVSPYYLPGIVDSFVKSAGNTKLAIEDLGNVVYANYDPDTEVNLYTGEVVIKNALETLTEGDRGLVLYNAFASRIPYAEYVADISRESSDYGLIAHNVPFRQLVMNGLTKYTTLNVNESSSGKAYYVLQALELGSSPKFKVTSKSVDRLKESNYNELYSTEYTLIADDIKSMYATISGEFAKIGTNEIVNHKILDEKVFETTYATGAKVVTNYNTFEVEVEGYGVISAEDYMVIPGEGTVENVDLEAEVLAAEGENATDIEETMEGGE